MQRYQLSIECRHKILKACIPSISPNHDQVAISLPRMLLFVFYDFNDKFMSVSEKQMTCLESFNDQRQRFSKQLKASKIDDKIYFFGDEN